jgi:glycosyltransferase involved in cell wall biosynthesis
LPSLRINAVNEKQFLSHLPSISIITPSFNQAQFIEETILSVLNQDYPNIEYIVVDGGSTDQTLDILKKYERRIKWLSEKDQGQADAVNKGLKMASGEIIGWLNSDDTYEPGCIQKVVACFLKSPEAVLVYGNGYQMNQEGKDKKPFIVRKVTFNKLSKINKLLQPSIFFKKETIEKVGYLDAHLHYVMDFELWVRFFKRYEKQTKYIPDYLSNWRLYPDTKTSLNRANIFQELFEVLLKHFGFVSSSWMVLYIAEILLGYQPSKGIRSFLFHQKWPFIPTIRILIQRYGYLKAIWYLGCFVFEAPFLAFSRIL